MTLIVAICLTEEEKDSILISSDSQATMGPITYRVHKIVPIVEPIDEQPIAIAAGAGDSAIVKKAIDISDDILCEASKDKWENEAPTFDQFNKIISKIENELIDKINFYKNKNLTFDFAFLLGSLSPEGVSSLYYFDERGLAQPVHDDPGFACIGSGFFLGGNLLIQQFYSEDLDMPEAVELTTYVINQVSMVDSGVGPFEGESWYLRLKNGKPFLGGLNVDSQLFKNMRRHYDQRQELLKYVWRESMYNKPKVLKRIIKKAIKNWEKEEEKKSK